MKVGCAQPILRPWQVLGPSRPPVALTLVPVCWLLERVSAAPAAPQCLGLVTLPPILDAPCELSKTQQPHWALEMRPPSVIPPLHLLRSQQDQLKPASVVSLGTKVMQNYQSACTADIYSPTCIDEMLTMPLSSVQHHAG